MNILFIHINHLAQKRSADAIPLNLGYILAYLKSFGHNGIIVDDLLDKPLNLIFLKEIIDKLNPGLVGFSAYNYQMNRVLFFARFIKLYRRDIFILLGGPNALYMPEKALDDLNDIDIICNRSEGEIATAKIVDAIEKRSNFSHIAGIVYKNNNRTFENPPLKKLPEDLDIYPSPYLMSLINLDYKTMASLFTSRGCKHFCKFCITPTFSGHKIRYHSIERVLDEMKYLNKQGIERFWIGDPNFTANRERTIKLMEEKIKKGIKSPFWCQTRVDQVDKDLLTLMREAGLDIIGFGLESGSSNVLNEMQKDIELQNLHEMIMYAQSIGIEIELFSMYGLPKETLEDAKKTLFVVINYKIPIYANSYAQRLQLYFGSEYEKHPEKYGFKIINKHRFAYMPIWHDYETRNFTQVDFENIHALWTLYNAEMELNVKNEREVFHVLDFLLSNKEILKKELKFYEYAIKLSCLLEESEILECFAKNYKENFTNSNINNFFFVYYEETNKEIDIKDRVIFEIYTEPPDIVSCNGLFSGIYEVNVVNNKIIRSFIGKTVDTEKIIHTTERGQVKGKIKILKVFKPKYFKIHDDFRNIKIDNDYSSITINRINNIKNQTLYYLTLKYTPLTKLKESPHHFLQLVSFYAKLHKIKAIETMLELIPDRAKGCLAVGDIVAKTGRYNESINFYNKSEIIGDELNLRKAFSYINCNKFFEALELLKKVTNKETSFYKSIYLECLKNIDPKNELIKKIAHDLLTQNVLYRLRLEETENLNSPIIHGNYNDRK